MPYVVLTIIIVVTLMIFILLNRHSEDEEEFLIDEIPAVGMDSAGLEKHALEISHRYSEVINTNCRRKVMSSLDKSYDRIINGYYAIDKDVKDKKSVVPAAEWLLDNLYLIEKEYKDIKHNMPPKYYKDLPVIHKGIMKGYPRIYHIAVEMVSHTEGRIDEDTIMNFINIYQKNTVLTTGELWALPIMLRIAIIQYIGVLTDKIVKAQEEKKNGEIIAERLINAFNDGDIEKELEKIAKENITFTLYFTERLIKLLRDNGVDNIEVYDWIDEKLAAEERNSGSVVALEHKLEASFQLYMGNCVNSIRTVEALNWRDYFEKLSVVESILRTDPANIYKAMDFESRDSYRHKIEKLAKYTNIPESYIAKKVIECASEAVEDESTCKDKEYLKHVGYYILDDGREVLKKKLSFEDKGFEKFKNSIRGKAVGYYKGAIIICTLIVMGFFILLSLYNDSNIQLWRYIIAALALAIPCSEVVISILNWSVNQLSTPTFIPKMEFKEGVPEEYSTAIIIPTLLNSPKRVHDLINDMEVYYLGNMDKNFYYVLLGDFTDGNNKEEKTDKEIIEAALYHIKALNDKYCSKGEERFFILNRYRQFNEKENKWLGWERKRGKIMEFNALLRGAKNTSYNTISSGIKNLKKVKYIITLDADTQLPRDSAKKLVGAMSHVLNRPYYNKSNKKVLRGYGLMQPRISVAIKSANKTLFSKIFSGETGIDMYTTAVSDVYQDLFGEGIFTGKGIYDVDVFEFMLNGEIPENSVLSHDLLEGSYVRTALVTDVEFVDGYPAYYNSSSMRLHRWVRGDWQLVPWLIKKSPLNKLSRWKIFDNLRRSLLAPSIVILLALACSGVLPDGTDKWFIAAFVALIAPILFDVSETVVTPIKGISLSGKMKNSKMAIEQVFLIFCFLPYQTYLMLDAIFRTLYRLNVSHKNMLEWQTAADVERKLGRKKSDFIKSMMLGSIIALLLLVLAFINSISIGIAMIPSCFIWFFSPLIAYYISKEIKVESEAFSEQDEKILRKLSRKTWAYFEDFVNDENNWLGPDNYQEEPLNGVATRTSPTNMGMGLTSSIVAYDLGYIGIAQTVSRIDKVITSMESLKMYKGHFYNWYDTVSKEPLYPRYISTVDSGNLVCYLWLVSESLEQYMKNPLISNKLLKGLTDTVSLANEELRECTGINHTYRIDINTKINVLEWINLLENIKSEFNKIQNENKNFDLYWNKKLENDVNNYLDEIHVVLPCLGIVLKDEGNDELVEIFNSLSCDTPITNIYNEMLDLNRNIKTNNSFIKDALKKNIELLSVFNHKVITLQERLNNMVNDTDFAMLFDKDRQLFTIGYDIENDSMGKSYYDLLASEARQASFIAIAMGVIPQKHWFKLGRALTVMGRSKGLVSWSGTMFEYLMPLLIMKDYPDTLLHETYIALIEAQKKYCADRGVPFGISESAFYTFDVNLNYQYKAFGVPGVGLKRGLVNELVISPYSTVMALQVDLKSSFNNLKRLVAEGMEGRYGFYEAVDYTKDRVNKHDKKAIVKCFMIHHEGMSLMALNNVLNNNILQERFHNIPKVKATELLLQEKVPKKIVYDREQQFSVSDNTMEKQKIVVRKFTTAKTKMPQTHLLSNGNYSIMLSNSGSGYSMRDGSLMYRWREDVTNQNTGWFFYVKDVEKGDYWSSTYEPCKTEGDNYEVTFSLEKGEFTRRDGDVVTHTQITVSNEDDAEIRRILLTNHGNDSKIIEVTSYCEVTMTHYDADIVHPAFNNLFVKTEYMENPNCIIATRRPRAKGKKQPWLMQCAIVEGNSMSSVQYETSRVNFIGRGRNIIRPMVIAKDSPLTNTIGAVLDPIISIRRRVKINPGETCKITYAMAVAETRDEVINLAKKYNEVYNIDRTFELAWSQTQVEMKYLGMKSNQANLYQMMASKILFINQSFKEREVYIKKVRKGQSALWSYGISGDVPIVLLIVRDDTDIDLVRQLLSAHEYLSMKGLKIDLVVLNLQPTSYTQPLQNSIRDLISSSSMRDKRNKAGGVFVHSISTIPPEDMDLLRAIARIVIDSNKGSMLVSQIKDNCEENTKLQPLLQTSKLTYSSSVHKLDSKPLEFFNELGGFDLEKNTYNIILKGSNNTPAPWINVISNGDFGFHVSEHGCAYTWYKNSRENKLTTWTNDWVSDTPSEALYLRDEITGDIWSITSKPIRDKGEYLIEHGFGYSTFKHDAYGILGEITMFCPKEESVKICKVKLKNHCDKERVLSATYYAELVMGVVPQHTATHIVTYLNNEKKYIYATNTYSQSFGNLHSYLKMVGGKEESFTGSKTEFLGIGGNVEKPEVLNRLALSNEVGAGLDPCLATSSKIKLKPNEEIELVVIFGEHEDLNHIDQVLSRYENIKNVHDDFEGIKEYWKELLGTVQVKTPEKTLDLMLNGWLMYQTIVCRIWARTAFYQSGGAYGFRDQLQDVMPVSYLDPQMTKNQILYSATRQFLEGDVQHWWHPVVDSGIRTRFSDDLLWLPFVTIDYIKNTGDYGILDEEVGYLEDTPLKEGEDERYNISGKSEIKGSIYEHCIKAIERGLKFGEHNIPLMGSGDWNDGMSEVGNKGKGESVWLGWFLFSILDGFKDICKYKGDTEKETRYIEMKEFIRENLEENAWDGSWYRRAYFDDGTPLGSSQNDECQIDSLSQSWAVISGAGKESRVKEAMESLNRYLVKEDKGMIFLLTPAFDKSDLEPGYIKGYVPGVRENGGQYTHASTWVILAFTKLGRGNRALRLFNMINPINHTKTFLQCERFKTEPYVMTADVYGVEPHTGRGGWSWYTGTSGWMYRVGIDGILGLKLKEGKGFTVEPCVPDDWNEYEMKYKKGDSVYNIHVIKGVEKGIWLNGKIVEDNIVPFLKEGEHEVKVII